MPRLPILAFGLLTSLALSAASAFADDPAHAAKGAGSPAATPAASTPAPSQAHAEPKAHDASKPAAGHAAPAPAHGAAPGAGHPGAPAAGDHGSGNPNILEPQPSLGIWTVAVFVLLLLILGKFAWGPILQALHDREEHMHQALVDAEKARNEAERIMVENRKQLALAADTVRELIEKGRADAQVTAESIVQKAQAEAEASLHRAEREIQSAKDTALTDIFSKTADLAVSVASKVLVKQLDEGDHKRLIEAAISELPTSPNGHGGHA